VSPDVLLADLEFAARAAGLFWQYNVPKYLARPRAFSAPVDAWPRAKAKRPAAHADATPASKVSSRSEAVLAGCRVALACVENEHC
jgi:hypothetical protein